MRRSRPRLSNATAGLLALGVCAVVVWLAFGGRFGGQGYTVTATFQDALNVKPGAPVRIAGVNVGKVVSVDHVGGGEPAARVKMAISDAGGPLHRDARFHLRPRIFLEGNLFVDVAPGSPSAPRLRAGAVVPIGQTASMVTFSETSRMLSSDLRRDLQDVLADLDRGLRPAGTRGFRRSLPHWKPAFRDWSITADAARGAPGDLPRLLRAGARTSAAFDRDPQALRALLRNLRVSTGAFARQRDRLEQALGEAPRVLDSARPALASLNRALPPARALAADARPGLRRVAPALRASIPLTRQLAGLVAPAELGGLARELRPAVPALARLAAGAAPALRELRPLSSCTNEVLLPFLNSKVGDRDFPAKGPVYDELAKSLVGLAGDSRSGDANGQWLRVLFLGGNYAYPYGDQFVLTSRPLMGANPPKPARGVPPYRPDVPCETQQPPDLSSEPAPPPSGFKVDTTSPAALALQDRGLKTANHWVESLLRRSRLDDRVRLSHTPLRAGDVSRATGKLP